MRLRIVDKDSLGRHVSFGGIICLKVIDLVLD
ncbi:Uncharacterised protein [Mycobacteroides abscessus subsp. abscessus]|nr:Uncharacterised protein [Mycobacteroides abscessus subsp. abscessus]